VSGINANTVLMLHGNGTDASTTFTDDSPSGHTVTPAGNAQIDTAISKFGGASMLFDGTGDYLDLDGSSDFAFGSGDFTIDFWIRFAALGVDIIWDQRPTLTNGLYPTIYTDGTNLLYFTDSADRITGTTNLSTGTFYHVALTRSGTSTRLFLDGTQEGSTYSDSNTYLNGSSRPRIGDMGFSSGNEITASIDEIRVQKGEAWWTGNFTPRTIPWSYGNMRGHRRRRTGTNKPVRMF